jgi:DNA-binding NarL/FixJ family response regulator
MDLLNLHGLAMAAEAAGDVARATEYHRAHFETWRATEDRHDGIPGLTAAATFFSELGRRDDVASIAEALERIAAATANPEAEGAALAASAELMLLDRDPAAAARTLQAALTAYEKRDLSVEFIRVRIRLGTAWNACGKTEEARTVLAEARQRARTLGARPLAAKADALLTPRASAAVREGEVAGVWELLSKRQREVARHLAAGFSNKEIAERLGVSVRTVEMHVGDVLARLDCRSRAQAAARVAAELK